MKTLLRLLVALLVSHPAAGRAEPRTPAGFVTAIGAAIREKSAEKLDALLCTEGMSAADRKMLPLMREMWLADEAVADISLAPLPETFQAVNIYQGRRMEPTAPPVGVVVIKYQPAGAISKSVSSSPYAVINGDYRLVLAKGTDLGWKGPPDRSLNFMVIGQGQNKVQIRAAWNVSGVDQVKSFASPSTSFNGQYFTEIVVTSTEDDTDVALTVREGGAEVFKSEQLKGKGTVVYRRKP